MSTIILKSISAKNYAAFADGITFTTQIDTSKKEYLDNTFVEGDNCYNKVSFIYGANGSGKSYFCRIMSEIQRIIDWSPISAMGNKDILQLPNIRGLNIRPDAFAFDIAYSKLPTSFSIEFVINKVTYKYDFTIENGNVIYEKLTKKYRRTETLILRTSSNYQDIILKSEFKSFNDTKQVVKKDSLCLPVAAMLNNKLALKLIMAIKSVQVVNMAAAKTNPPDVKVAFSKERIEKYVNILKKADPTIQNLDVSFEEKELSRKKINNDDFENREIISTQTTIGITTTHNTFSNGVETEPVERDFFTTESLGTVKLFTSLPYIFNALENGSTIFIDEIENGLHLSLAKEIIQLFNDEKTNPRHAQLICTSHQPLLIEGGYRRDQIWVAQKENSGKSTLHRISEKKTQRAKVNVSKIILEGAFGCNPEKFFN